MELTEIPERENCRLGRLRGTWPCSSTRGAVVGVRETWEATERADGGRFRPYVCNILIQSVCPRC